MMEYFERVRQAIAEAVGVDPSTIAPETSLLRDLGVDSLDLLDVVYRLEKEFDIEIPQDEIERRLHFNLAESEVTENGTLSEDARQRLRSLMPEVAESEFASILKPSDIPRLLTVATLERLVREQLAAATTSPAAEGHMPAENIRGLAEDVRGL